MASFRETFIIYSILSVFVFAMFSFVITMQTENDSTSSILENDIINKTFISLGGNISSQESSVQNQSDSFNNDIPEKGFGSLIVFAIVGVAQKFMGLILATFNILIVLPITVLGVPDTLANVLGSILVVSLIFLAWRVYRVGS